MYELKQIKISSTAKLFSLFFAILYFLGTLLLSGLRFLGRMFEIDFLDIQMPSLNLHEYLIMNILVLLIGTFVFAVLGVLFGMIIALVYNFISKKSGGIKLDFKLVEENKEINKE